MTILLPALAVTFAAFCLWLTVRMVNRRERWAKWALAATLALPVLYVASFGPAVWITARKERVDQIGQSVIYITYQPLLSAIVYGPRQISGPLYWWGELGVGNGRQAFFDV